MTRLQPINERINPIFFLKHTFGFLLAVCIFTHTTDTRAQTPQQDGASQPQAKSASGLPLPRFVSISGHEVNLRTGPGLQYPIEWVYRLKGLPLEIIAEYKTWRKVRDWEGAQGWVHQTMLNGKRAFIITNGPHPIYKNPENASKLIARAETGVVGELLNCEEKSQWCRVKADGFEGWLKRESFWGVMNEESVN
ncbi:MAG: SH3 domain-containing protein [Rhodospirillaceae bacterium]|nr:SH3 domain-containing protein [Rhodospirillaceae bacterium]